MSIPPLTAPELSAASGIRHGFFTRAGGVSGGLYSSLNCGLGSSDDPLKVRQNRGRVAAAVGGSREWLLSPYQVHGTDVLVVDAPFAGGHRPKADALVTRTP